MATASFPPRVVVSGTGTGVGKTYVSCALTRALRRHYPRSLALKPVESGYRPEGSDAAALSLDGPLIEPRYALLAALSPHRAAALAGSAIVLSDIVSWIASCEHNNRSELTLVETAGGLFTPLSWSETNLDLVRALEPCIWLLVAANRLGVLHDTQAAVRAARAEHRSPDAIILNTAVADDSSPSNLTDLQRLMRGLPVLEFSDSSGAGSLTADGLVRWLKPRLATVALPPERSV